jgi:hypothetical protein
MSEFIDFFFDKWQGEGSASYLDVVKNRTDLNFRTFWSIESEYFWPSAVAVFAR